MSGATARSAVRRCGRAREDEEVIHSDLMSGYFNYDELSGAFYSGGAEAGLESCIATLRAGGNEHALFRLLLLKKRRELGLPLLNPGDLSGYPENLRAEYKAYADTACREAGVRCLEAGEFGQAWRYFSALNEPGPVRAALEKIEAGKASDDALKVALEYGLHPRRGFQMTLERDGLGKAIALFESGFSAPLADKKYAAALLVRKLYKDLVIAVCKAILEKDGALPPERELVDLIMARKWLFDDNRSHADAQHIAAVSRISLLCAAREELIMSLSISEYGRLLSSQHQPSARAPFEEGFAEHARYARALLGQNESETADYFRCKLPRYQGSTPDTYPAEMVLLLFWRLGRKEEALDIWQNYLAGQPPEQPGICTPSFYEMCAETKNFYRWTETARQHDDVVAWAAARIAECAPPAPLAPEPPPEHEEPRAPSHEEGLAGETPGELAQPGAAPARESDAPPAGEANKAKEEPS
jgi:hypothetical protein